MEKERKFPISEEGESLLRKRHKERVQAALLKLTSEGANDDNLANLAKVVVRGAGFMELSEEKDWDLLMNLWLAERKFQKEYE